MSFSDYAAAFNYKEPPRESFKLDRGAVLERQAQTIAREEYLDSKREIRTRKVTLGQRNTQRSILELDQRQVVNLMELRLNEIGKGKVLLLRIVSNSVRLAPVQFVAEDSRGNVVPVSVYYVPQKYSRSDLDDIYPVGALFGVVEPNLRPLGEGYVVRVETPLDLIRLWPTSPLVKSTSFAATSFYTTPQSFKDAGNRHYSAGKYHRALEAYSAGIEPAGKELEAVLRCNRAAVLLKLGRPGAALKDCDTALRMVEDEKLRTKLLFRAATAEYDLGEYSAAESRLTLEPLANDPAAIELLDRTRSRLRERKEGIYDWATLFATSQKVDRLDIADYQGPVEIASIKGKGRGLIATRDIEVGELLLVARPFASGRGDPERYSFTVGVNTFTESMDPYALVELIALLLEKSADDPKMLDRLSRLHPGDVFDTPESQATVTPLDISRLEGIVTFNSFHPESLSEKSAPHSLATEAANHIHSPSSLYDLPSYLNHSCVGNISYSFLADTIFFRAKLAVKKGEELVDSYVDSLEGYEVRRGKIEKHGFVCRCELCEGDQFAGEVTLEERRMAVEEVSQLTDRIHSEKEDSLPFLEEIIELAKRVLETYDEERSTLRPGLYSVYRLLSQTLASNGRAGEAMGIEVKALESLGARFEKTGAVGGWEMIAPTRIGDVNACLSLLFIAKHVPPKFSKRWVDHARTIEKGQAGEELFVSRYSDWAKRNDVSLEGGMEAWGSGSNRGDGRATFAGGETK